MRRLPAIAALAVLFAVLALVAPAPPAPVPTAAAASENVVRTVSERTVQVARPAEPKGIRAKSGIVLDAQTGMQLWGQATRQRRLIASTTKIMTALVAVARTEPDQMLTASDYRGGIEESLLGLEPGERMSAQDLIKGLLLVSGNDAADTLAVGTAGSRSEFVAAMNRRARQLGLRDTHFDNAIGLDGKSNWSTAADLAQLGRVALTVPRIADVVDKAEATLRSGNKVRRIENHNPLVPAEKWAIGVKTGHTMAAGYLLVGAAKKSDAHVVSVVTGEPTELARAEDSKRLLEFGRGFYRAVRPLETDTPVYEVPVFLQKRTVAVLPQRDVSFGARNGEQISVRLDAPKEIEGPRERGDVVGRAIVIRGGREVADVPVELAAAVPAPPFLAVALHTVGQILPWLVLAAVLIIVFLLLRRRRLDRTRRPGFVL